MPQLGETVTEGTITKWYKAVGDQVARDEPLFEVSTDKVDSEVPSPAEGVLTAILVRGGRHRRRRRDPGRDRRRGLAPTARGIGACRRSAPEPVRPAAGPPSSRRRRPAGGRAPHAGPDCRRPSHTGDPSPAPTPEAPPGRRHRHRSGDGLVLSPVVRKLLNEHDIDPSTVRGTGLGGRITRSDVEAAIAGVVHRSTGLVRRSGAGAEHRRPPPAGSTGRHRRRRSPASGWSPARDEVVPFTNIRRRTAEHMVRSKATSAHTLMVKEIDYERVEQVRRAHGERFRAEEGFGLTYLPFAARATVEALAEFPHLNASVGDDALIVHHDINLGIAVDLDNEGLIVPVVHNAEELNLRGMARRIRDVADRARTKRLSLDDISGGTFSITNAGPFGTLITGAIINQPQVAILSTDGVARKPVVVELPDGTESIAIHSVGLVAMTFDHRAVDGAYVARYPGPAVGDPQRPRLGRRAVGRWRPAPHGRPAADRR